VGELVQGGLPPESAKLRNSPYFQIGSLFRIDTRADRSFAKVFLRQALCHHIDNYSLERNRANVNSLSVGNKIILCFVAFLLLFVVLSGVAYSTFHNMKNAFDNSVDNTAKKVFLLNDLSSQRASMKMSIRGMIMYTFKDNSTQAEVDRKAFHQGVEQFSKDLSELKPLITTEDGQQSIAKLEADVPVYQAHFAEIDKLCRDGKAGDAADYALSQIRAVTDDMASQIELMNRHTGDVFGHDRRTIQESFSSFNVVGGVMSALGVLVGFGLLYQVRHLTVTLSEMAGELAAGSGQVAGAAAHVTSSSHSLARGATEQAAALQETLSSATEISSLTGQNAQNSSESAKVMSHMAEQIAEGNRKLGDLIVSMKEIDSSSGRISKIIKTIDEIAFQTNILALNAAVEAARAGQAGMGFAVVADEVRNLAQRCAKAAQETSELIAESVSKSSDGARRVDEVAVAIEGITRDAEQVKALVDEVNSGSQRQASGLGQISKAICEMEQLTQKNAASAEEGASAGEELTAQSESLRRFTGRLNMFVRGRRDAA
jgi:methyl-accepting chemotaxis protein/methyl-accepting chemotaxis protein-1 (serine sensor receptor)